MISARSILLLAILDVTAWWPGVIGASAAERERPRHMTTNAPPTVEIDARYGAQKAVYVYPTTAAVTVKITNKNPFLFRYRLSVTETKVEEPAIAAFLAQLAPGFKGFSETRAFRRSESPPPPAETCDPNDVEKMARRLEDIYAWHAQVMTDSDDVRGGVEAIANEHFLRRETYLRIRSALRRPWAGAAELRQHADQLVKTFGDYLADGKAQADVVAAVDRLAAVRADALALVGQIEDTRKAFPRCQPSDKKGADALLAMRSHLLDLTGRVAAEQKAQLDAAREDIVTFTSAHRETTAVQEDPTSFEQIIPVPQHAEATTLVISLERWPIADKDDKGKQTVAATTVMFGGGQRFYLSGGIAYARGVATNDFQPGRGFARDREGAVVDPTTMTTIVALERQSPNTIVPMALLNMRAWREWFATTGVTVRKDNDGVHLDYLLGGSFAAFDRKVFLTLGWYYGRQASLAGDLYVGAEIPATMASIPVRTEYVSGLAVVLTFKIR